MRHLANASDATTACAGLAPHADETLVNDAGRWTWCPDCLTLFDDYGKAINAFPEFVRIH
jgi:hypothetical protein